MHPFTSIRLGTATDGEAWVGSPVDFFEKTVSAPYERMATGAIGGAVLGTAVAAVIGLSGQTIGPGNRMAMLALLAVPVAGTVLGVLWATR